MGRIVFFPLWFVLEEFYGNVKKMIIFCIDESDYVNALRTCSILKLNAGNYLITFITCEQIVIELSLKSMIM